MQGIYAIKNKTTGKYYIGLSRNVKHRIAKHKFNLKRNIHNNQHLQSAWNMYGSDAFEFSILEEVEQECDLGVREQYYINLYDSQLNGYNNTYGGESTFQHTDETRRAIGTKAQERARDPEYMARHIQARNTPEFRDAIRGANNGMSKLTELDVIQIRLEYLKRNTHKARYGFFDELRQRYPGVYKGTLQKIAMGITWKHLPNTVEELESMLINYQT